jgi:hypothetical protein
MWNGEGLRNDFGCYGLSKPGVIGLASYGWAMPDLVTCSKHRVRWVHQTERCWSTVGQGGQYDLSGSRV